MKELDTLYEKLKGAPPLPQKTVEMLVNDYEKLSENLLSETGQKHYKASPDEIRAFNSWLTYRGQWRLTYRRVVTGFYVLGLKPAFKKPTTTN